MKRFLIAAPSSGSGKTMFTCGMLELLKREQDSVISYKCGPDYIDPMFHRTVLGIPSQNLDTFFQSPEEIKELLHNGAKLSVIEGVMGLYDGLGGTREEGSAYHLAELTNTPILLVLDAHGMGRTMVALLKGIVAYDKSHLIKGVVLNRTSKAFCQTIAPIIEEEVGIHVYGFLPKLKGVSLESRHLGLKLPSEVANLREQVCKVADAIADSVDLSSILADAEVEDCFEEVSAGFAKSTVDGAGLTLAVARDEAFCFYYEQNLEAFRECGVKIVEFSPLHDAKLPECQGLLLGGGYPELGLAELSGNTSMRQSIKEAIEAGLPSLAECGGFMYLHDSIEDQNKKLHSMVGVIPGSVYNTGKLCRFGYVNVDDYVHDFRIKAHEFHYYDSTNNGSDCRAIKPTSGKDWECMHSAAAHLWGFPHLYYKSQPKFMDWFLRQMKAYQGQIN